METSEVIFKQEFQVGERVVIYRKPTDSEIKNTEASTWIRSMMDRMVGKSGVILNYNDELNLYQVAIPKESA